MNKKDKANLDFILKSETEEFEKWMKTASSDDIDYAIELLRLARLELSVQEIDIVDSLEEELNDYTEAKKVIDRIRNAR